MIKLLKWTIFLPLTLLVVLIGLSVASDSVRTGVIRLLMLFVALPVLALSFVLYVSGVVLSEWGMGKLEVEHEKALIILNQADKQIDKHEGVIKRLNLSIEAGKRQIKEDTHAAQIEGKPAPRTDGAKMSHQASDWFLKAPHTDSFMNIQAGYDTKGVKTFRTFTAMKEAIGMHKWEVARLKAIRKPYYEKHLEFHKVRVERQIAEVGEYWAGWQKKLREKIGNEYADNGAHRPEDVKEL
jgi:hypothetical protein